MSTDAFEIPIPSDWIPPTSDPFETDVFTGFSDMLIDRIMHEMKVKIPAQVISYQASPSPTVTVQINIQLVLSTGKILPIEKVINVPVQVDGGGGFLIIFPLTGGDQGWLEACDKDISTYKQSWTSTGYPTSRKHSWSDAVFVPSVNHGFTLAADNGLLIQSLDGSIFIQISQSGINITHPTAITLNAETVAITGTNLTHNGIDVGDNHVHPQENDSGGNTEQDTGAPKAP